MFEWNAFWLIGNKSDYHSHNGFQLSPKKISVKSFYCMSRMLDTMWIGQLGIFCKIWHIGAYACLAVKVKGKYRQDN